MSHIELQTIRNLNMNQEEIQADYQLRTNSSEEEKVPLSPSRRTKRSDVFRDESEMGDDEYEEHEMSLQELLYSSSSFYAIVVPGKWTFRRLESR